MEVKIVYILFVVIGLKQCSTADPTLSQTSITDSVGNSADENSAVTFASIPTASSYKASDTTYSSTGIEWYYSLQTLFIDNLVFPDGFPTETIEGILDGTVTKQLVEGYSGLSVFSSFIGYVALIAIGFIFIVIFPLIGFCFCCCRCCCGNCGGAPIQKKVDAENTCKRRTFVVFLLIMNVFIVFGMVCTYITNANITLAVNELDTNINNNLDDIESYIDTMVTQVKHMGKTNFNFTQDVINRDLNSIGYLLGIPVRSTLETDSGITVALASVLTLANQIAGISTAIAAVNSQVTVLQTAASSFTTSMNILTTLVDDTNTDCGACNGQTKPTMTNYALQLNTGNFPDLTTQTTKITELSSTNFTALTETAKSDLDQIPERVQNETTDTVANITAKVSDFSDKIDPMINAIEDIQQMLKDNFIANARNILNTTSYKSYDNYRYLGGIGVACSVLLIVILILIGLLLAIIGHKDVKPTERTCSATCGGHFLMLSVGFVFIFSSLLLLLTTLVFTLGTPLKRFVCEPMTDTEFASEFSTILDTTIYKGITGNDSGSYIGTAILNNSTANITLEGLLRDCYNNKGVYVSLKLEDKINTTQLTDYKSSISLDTELTNINVDLSTTEVLTTDLESKLDDFNTAVTIDFSAFYTELNADATANSIDGLITLLANLETNAQTAALRTDYGNHKTMAESIKTYQLASVETEMATLNTTVAALEALVSGVSTIIDDVKVSLNNSQNYLQINGSTAIQTEASAFSTRLFTIVDYFVNDTIDALNNELGACKPVYNLYNSVVRISLCRYIVDSLNGFWFALGLCVFFFIPSIIFATKLAKHYRRMEYAEEEEETETEVKSKEDLEDSSSSDDEEQKNVLRKENSFYRRFLRAKRIQDPFGNAVQAFALAGKNKVAPSGEPPPYTVAPAGAYGFNAFSVEKKGAAW